MNILLLDPHGSCVSRIHEVDSRGEELNLLDLGQFDPSHFNGPAIDLVIGNGNFEENPGQTEVLVKWRTHPHTFLVPCWIEADLRSFQHTCLWPQLSIDRFAAEFDPESFGEWLISVAEWQANRSRPIDDGTLNDRGFLEIAAALAVSRVTGTLHITDEEGGEGFLALEESCCADMRMNHLQGEEAFHQMMCLAGGTYFWEPGAETGAAGGGQPLQELISESLHLLHEANLLFSLTEDFKSPLRKTSSKSALDDRAVPFFEARKLTYDLIDGKLTVDEVIEASPLSRPRAMKFLARLISYGDVTTSGEDPDDSFSPRRLLIVDDSRVITRALESIFSKDLRFKVVGIAKDGVESLELVERLHPDVVTMDIEMPRMDGLTALKHIMIKFPRPVVVVSAFTKETSELTYQAFKYGAVDVITKPSTQNRQDMDAQFAEIRERVSQAARVRLEAAQYIRKRKGSQQARKHEGKPVSTEGSEPHIGAILVYCGAGGFPSAIRLLASIPESDELPPIVACMALPEAVVDALSPHLARDCQIQIARVSRSTELSPNICYLYSLQQCFRLSLDGSQIRLENDDKGMELGYPVDCLFTSATNTLGGRVAALVVSGTGVDGVSGMRRVQQQGGYTIVLSPDACLRADLPERLLRKGYGKKVDTVTELADLIATPTAIEHLFRDQHAAANQAD